MDYTLEDLRGKYVKVGTPEAEVFLDACDELEIVWASGAGKPRDYNSPGECIAVGREYTITHCDEYYYRTVSKYKPFTPKPQWSIYTNDKPLCELSDDQYGKMRRSNDTGAVVEVKNVQADQWVICNPCVWNPKAIYRIKQKSECELFVDKCLGFYDGGTLFDDSVMKMLESAFDAGCRFTKDN